MKTAKLLDNVLSKLLRLTLFALLFQAFGANATLEDKFSVLQIGTTTYRNVTVTTKNKSYIFLLHSKGMTNIKVADLPSDVRLKLGYEDLRATQVKTNTPAAWARQTLSKIEPSQVKQLQERLLSRWPPGPSGTRSRLPSMSPTELSIAAVVLIGLYLFHSYCCLLICRKTGFEPGILVWLPLLQLVPLLKAAAMSPWWVLGFLIPGVNLVAQVLWCLKITQARGKPFPVALLLIFPLSSPFAAFYLAFSGKKRSRNYNRRVEIMTLETA